eukprot:gene9967-11801_t
MSPVALVGNAKMPCRSAVEHALDETSDGIRKYWRDCSGEEELFQVLQRRGNKAFVLFPAENASSFAKLAGLSSAADGSSEIGVTSHPLSSTRETEDEVPEEWDIVVLDGT